MVIDSVYDIAVTSIMEQRECDRYKDGRLQNKCSFLCIHSIKCKQKLVMRRPILK